MNKAASPYDKEITKTLSGIVNKPFLRQEVEFLVIEKTGRL